MKRKLKWILICFLSLVFHQRIQGQNPNWSVNSRSFDYQMQFTASLKINGVALTNTNDQVAVFVGNELRGVGNITFNSTNQKYVSFFTAYSNTINETLTFKIYNSTTDTVYDAIQTKTFIIEEQVGGVFQSFVISNTTLNNEADIIDFNFQSITAVSNSKSGNEFNIVVPQGTVITTLTPVFNISNGANTFINFVKQNSNTTAVDFSNPVTYQVLSQDEKVLNEFVINVAVATSSDPPTAVLSTTENATTKKKQVSITLTFSESISGLSEEDFTSINSIISNVNQLNTSTYTATLTFINQGNATIKLIENTVLNTNSIGNLASNTLSFSYDNEQPILQSQEHFVDEKYFQLTFSKAVSNVDVTDFVLSGNLNTYFNIDNIQQISASIYNVFYTGTTSETGNLYIQINNNATITDIAANPIIKQNVEAYYLNNSIAPIFENDTPNVTNITETSFSIHTDSSLAGTIYYVVLPNNAAAPNSTEVKNGTGNQGTSVITSGNANTNSGDLTNTFNISGLNKETAYDVYVVAEDNEPTPNLQSNPTLVEVTLPKKSLPSGINMKDISGGTFTLGNDNLIGSPDQKIAAPEYQVTLSSFAMSEAEITNSQYVEFLNTAYSGGLIEIVIGTAGPDKDKKIIVGSSSSNYSGEVLYTIDGTRVLKDHGNEDGDDNEFTGSVEPENPLNISYIGFNSSTQTFYVKDPFNINDFHWKDICDYQDYGTTPKIFQGTILNDFDDWAGAGANYSNELEGWTENNPAGATNLPTQTEVAAWPVTFIRWRGAKAFADFYNVTLPTEAQWEYAAKGGSNFEYAVYDGQSVNDANWNQAGIDNLATGHVRRAISGNANPFGLYNLAGNVWEWIADNYVAPYDTSITTNPFIEESGSTIRSWRGGAWNYHEATLQSSIRFYDEQDRGNDHFGFRITGTHSSTDNLPPTPKTLSLQSASLANVTSITYTAVFNEVVNLVSADDFILTKTGSSNGLIGTPTTTDNISWQISISNISGDGTLRLDLKEGATIQDDAGNTIQVSKTGDNTHTSDFTDPTFDSASSTPNHNGTNFTTSANIVMAFNEDITFGTNKIVICEVATNTIIEEFDVTVNNTGGNNPASGEIGIYGRFLYINPTNDFIADGREYAIRMNANAIDDLNGNSFAGMSNNSFYSFSTAIDTTKPVIDGSNSSPLDNATSVATSRNIVIDFTEPIKVKLDNNGIIRIIDRAENSTYQRFEDDDYQGTTSNPASGSFGIVDDKIYINPASNLKSNTEYSILVINFIEDIVGNDMTNTFNRDNYNFKTASIVWRGHTNTDWSIASNWNTNQIPTATDDILVPNFTNQPFISTGTSAEANNITVEVSSNISIASAGSLTVNGDLTNNGNAIRIGAGGSIIVNGDATGNITYNRDIPTTDWFLISSPVKGLDIDEFVSATDLATGSGNNIGFAPYKNDGTKWNYYQAGSSGTGNFEDGKGYAIKMANSGTISFTGGIPTTDITTAISKNANGFNLIGNPYPSYIATNNASNSSRNILKQLSTDNDFLEESTIWIWNKETTSYDPVNHIGSRFMAPGQGFFIRAKGSFNFDFTEDMQTHQSTDNFQKTANPTPEIKLIVSAENQTEKETMIYYVAGTTTGFDDGYDSSIFSGVNSDFILYTALVSDSEGQKLGIQTLPNENYQDMVIPIGVVCNKGTISFKVYAKNIPTGYQIFIEDSVTESFIRLDEANTSYEITLKENLNDIGRFYLHTTNKNTLNTDEFNLNSIGAYLTNKNNLRIIGLHETKTTLTLFDTLGKASFATSFKGKSINNINIPKVKQGVYIIRITSEKGNYIKKIVIE